MADAPVPRLRVAPPCHANDADLVVELMANYGTRLDPWQVDALEAGLGVREDGSWAAHTVGINVPRQNGKTICGVSRALSGGLMFGEKVIVVSAHEQRTCRLMFQELLGYFDAFDELRRRTMAVVSALGREEIRLKDGTRWLFPSRTRSNLRGFSLDCLIVDEAQLTSDEQWEAARPAMAARPNSVAWHLGTAPQLLGDAQVFGRLRAEAYAGGNGDLAWVEYGAPEGADLDDRAVWLAANPGRVELEAIAGERRELSPAGFARERLNIWPTESTERVIDPAWWAQLAGGGPAAGVAPVALAVDAGPDRATAVAGAWPMDGRIHVEVLLVDRDPLAAASFVTQRAGRRIPVIVDGASSARAVEPLLTAARVKVRVTTAAEMAVAAGGFLDAVNAGLVSHSGNRELAAAVEGARRRSIGDAGQFGWDRRDGSVFLSPLVAATLARWGASTARPRSNRATFV